MFQLLAQLGLYALLIISVFLVILRLLHAHINSGKLARRLAFLSRTSLAASVGSTSPAIIVGFFHPYADAGGGGERVLWTAVRSTLDSLPSAVCVIYSGDNPTETTSLKTARILNQFGIQIDPTRLLFIPLKRRRWVDAKSYPRFTLLGQSLGSVFLAWEALTQLIPDVWIDTAGYAFTYPLARYMGHAKVIAYVHYPLISTDMLTRVRDRVSAHNNTDEVSKSSILTTAKLIYYQTVAWAYGLAGGCADLTLVNSSWTLAHIKQLWPEGCDIALVYPPCDLLPLLNASRKVSETERRGVILSVAQFRPEKDHVLMIRAFARFLAENPELENINSSEPRLVLVGGCRNEEDRARVDGLRKLAKELAVAGSVEFVTNAPVDVLRDHLSRSSIALHAMWNEHFGISVAEFLAAGLITIAHNSAGPRQDIVREVNGKPSGILAETEEEYAIAIRDAWRVTKGEHIMEWRERARQAVEYRFGEAEFVKHWHELVVPIVRKSLIVK